MRNYRAALRAVAVAHVHYVVSVVYHVEVVLYGYDGCTTVYQVWGNFQQNFYVELIQADRRFVEHMEHVVRRPVVYGAYELHTLALSS